MTRMSSTSLPINEVPCICLYQCSIDSDNSHVHFLPDIQKSTFFLVYLVSDSRFVKMLALLEGVLMKRSAASIALGQALRVNEDWVIEWLAQREIIGIDVALCIPAVDIDRNAGLLEDSGWQMIIQACLRVDGLVPVSHQRVHVRQPTELVEYIRR